MKIFYNFQSKFRLVFFCRKKWRKWFGSTFSFSLSAIISVSHLAVRGSQMCFHFFWLWQLLATVKYFLCAIMRFFLVIFCVLVPNVFAQSEILYKFLQLNREHLRISESCENDLQIIEEGLESEDVWALKCELKKLVLWWKLF